MDSGTVPEKGIIVFINTEVIFEGKDFESIGFEATSVQYSTTILSRPGNDIVGFQLYHAEVPEVLFAEIIMTHQFYVVVEIPADRKKAQDISKLRIWAISEAMGDVLIGYHEYVASYIDKHLEHASTGASSLDYGLFFPNGMSKEEADSVDMELLGEEEMAEDEEAVI